MKKACETWLEGRVELASGKLVFSDETWVKTNMARDRGRSARGARLISRVPHGHWKTTTFLAALRVDRVEAPLALDGPINGATFDAFVEQLLAPTLQPGDIVVVDDLGSHKGDAARRAIEARGAELRSVALLARSQSDREAVRQAQGRPVQSGRADGRQPLATYRHAARRNHAPGMPKLPPSHRIDCYLIGLCSEITL